MSQKTALFDTLNRIARDFDKTAAAVPADPGGMDGASSHPTAKVDNSCQVPSSGARTAENDSDVKADIGAPGVNSTPEGVVGSQDSVQPNIGTTQSATGEDPASEDAYKSGKDDPGSTHEARTDNSALDGHKYASMSITALKSFVDTAANEILAHIATGQKIAAAGATPGTLSPGDATTAPSITPKKQMAGEAPEGEKIATARPDTIGGMIEKAAAAVAAGKNLDSVAAANPHLAAGYELAAKLGLEKQAAQAEVAGMIEDTIRDATLQAELFANYYETLVKRATDTTSAVNEGESQDEAAGSSGANAADGNKDQSSPSSSGGDAPHKEPDGDEAAAGGEASDDAILEQLAAALDELGMTPEQLLMAIQGAGDPAAAGGAPPMDPMAGGAPPTDPMAGGAPPMDPMAGGAPPMDPMAGGGAPPMDPGMKMAAAKRVKLAQDLAANVTAFKRTGKYKLKAANQGTPERALRDQMRGVVLELLRR